MADVKTERLSRQLKAQADSILSSSGFELAQEVLETCCALLRLAEETVDPGQLDQLDQDMLTDNYQTVADYVSGYIKKSGLVLTDEDALTKGSGETLRELKEKRIQLAKNAQKQLGEITKLTAAINGLEQSIEGNKRQITALETTQAGLRDSLKQFTPELFQQLKDGNKALYDAIAKKQDELDQLNDERIRREEERDKIQRQIDELPDTLKKLRADMDALEEELDRIRKAEETCSAEKQAEVSAQTEKLKEQLAEDSAAFEELTRRRDELLKSVTQYDSDTQTLETDAIDLINKTIRALRPKLEKHQRALERIRDENAQIESSYSECNTLRQQFNAWFTNDQTPLEKLMDALKSEGNLNLKGTLDLRNCENIQKAVERIRSDLQYLDDILAQAARAYGMDVQKLRQRAIGKAPK